MTKFSNYEPKGVIPACLLPFHTDLSIDEPSYRKHLRDVTSVRGLSAITINAHASEVASCTFEEQERVLAITMDEIGDRIPIVHGILRRRQPRSRADRAHGAEWRRIVFARISAEPARARFALAARDGDRTFQNDRRCVRSADHLFSIPARGRSRLSGRNPAALAEAVPTRVRDQGLVQQPGAARAPDSPAARAPAAVNVLSTHSSWLFSSLVLGCDGLLSGSGSVIPDLQSALWHAVKANDLARAKQLNDRIYPIAQAFYADPFVDMHNRMKEALVILGRIPCAAVRPPLVKLTDAEIARIRNALDDAQIAREGALRLAA
jgi:4-hydroxy-tetrahydrodipicolinate synthase